MKHSKSQAVLALVLAITIAATGCSAQWINVAWQDLSRQPPTKKETDSTGVEKKPAR